LSPPEAHEVNVAIGNDTVNGSPTERFRAVLPQAFGVDAEYDANAVPSNVGPCHPVTPDGVHAWLIRLTLNGSAVHGDGANTSNRLSVTPVIVAPLYVDPKVEN
jgi:hypothetical protein